VFIGFVIRTSENLFERENVFHVDERMGGISRLFAELAHGAIVVAFLVIPAAFREAPFGLRPGVIHLAFLHQIEDRVRIRFGKDPIRQIHKLVSRDGFFRLVLIRHIARPPNIEPDLVKRLANEPGFFVHRHLAEHVHDVVFVIDGIFSAHEINESEGVFPSNHQILEFVRRVPAKSNDTETGDGNFALVKRMALFAAIVAILLTHLE